MKRSTSVHPETQVFPSPLMGEGQGGGDNGSEFQFFSF